MSVARSVNCNVGQEMPQGGWMLSPWRRVSFTGVAFNVMSVQLTVHEAVYAFALHRYVLLCLERGEKVTEFMADEVATVAASFGMHPTIDLPLFGFVLKAGYVQPLSDDVLTRILDQIGRARMTGSMQRFWTAVESRARRPPETSAVAKGRLS